MCEKCDQVRAEILAWANKQGHDQCWYYPEIFIAIAEILDMSLEIKPKLPPQHVFREHCQQWESTIYSDSALTE